MSSRIRTRAADAARTSRRHVDDLDALADSLFETSHDGGAPRRDDRGRARALGSLCREAERAIAYALACVADPALQGLVVRAVTPAPDATRLCIDVVAPLGVDLDATSAALVRATGVLRTELARALQRKRTPTLTFVLGLDGEVVA